MNHPENGDFPGSGTESEPEVILLALTGMSPAVLTETIWALAHEAEPVIPSRVIAVTTAHGAQTIRQSLFQPQSQFGNLTPWDALRTALQSQGHSVQNRLRFGATADDLRVITTLDVKTGLSRELDDIRDREDNEATANYILDLLRAIVENPDTRLIASLAGGRKTMGALLYACMTLVGRETDRLTHVLVNEPYETLSGFYFPNQPGGALRDREGHSQDPDHARVDLADVPFVALRNLFIRDLGRPAGGFTRLMETCRRNVRQQAGENLRLILNRTRPEIEINGQLLKLSAREHLLLLFLASRAKDQMPPILAYKEAIDPLEEFRQLFIQSTPEGESGDWRFQDSLRQPLEERDICRTVSDLRRKIQGLNGEPATLALCLPEKGRFSLDLPGSMIHIK